MAQLNLSGLFLVVIVSATASLILAFLFCVRLIICTCRGCILRLQHIDSCLELLLQGLLMLEIRLFLLDA